VHAQDMSQQSRLIQPSGSVEGLARPSRGREQAFLGENVAKGGAEGDSRMCKKDRDIPFGPAVGNTSFQTGD